jgi:3-phenylpropionate/cinnamic acid dioxygenase small subunit
MSVSDLLLLTDRAAISDVVIRYARSLDMQDWEMCRSCFADDIEQDYSDFRGEPPASIKADAFVALRREALTGIKTQHLSTNHAVSVEGDGAVCISAMVIFRFRPDGTADNEFDTHGYYTHSLARTPEGWKINKVKQTVLWSKGNPQIHGFHRGRSA